MEYEISTDKFNLAQSLAEYSGRERRQIVRAAKHLRKFMDLTSVELTEEEELDETINELEKEEN